MSKPKIINFEKAMAELETIVNSLEHGTLSLDESLKQFEQGVVLSRKCQDILEQAEQKIEILGSVKADKINLGEDFDV